MICFYHASDFDGKCSGALVHMAHPECELIGVDYTDTLRDVEAHRPLKKGETVFVVDFCFSESEMMRLYEDFNLIWIDHHRTSIEKMERFMKAHGLYSGDIHGPRCLEFDGISASDKRSGCDLTWEYLHEGEKAPYFVRLLGRYDVWDHSNPDVLNFQYGIRQEKDTHPRAQIWKDLRGVSVNPILASNTDSGEIVTIETVRIIETGKIILKYQEAQNSAYANRMAFDAVLLGHRAVVINTANSNALVFKDAYDPEKHDIMIAFSIKPGECSYSIYSEKPNINAGKIAKEFGGGGHKGAAGFTTVEPLTFGGLICTQSY